VLLVVSALAACTDDGSQYGNDFGEPMAGTPTHVVDAGHGWTINVFDTKDCMQATNGAVTTRCISLQYPQGSGEFAVFRGSGLQVGVAVQASATPVSTRWWSREQQRVDVPMVEVARGLRISVLPFASGDEPWGVQARQADGTVIQIAPFVAGDG
jgi:hypothetical protein